MIYGVKLDNYPSTILIFDGDKLTINQRLTKDECFGSCCALNEIEIVITIEFGLKD